MYEFVCVSAHVSVCARIAVVNVSLPNGWWQVHYYETDGMNTSFFSHICSISGHEKELRKITLRFGNKRDKFLMQW